MLYEVISVHYVYCKRGPMLFFLKKNFAIWQCSQTVTSCFVYPFSDVTALAICFSPAKLARTATADPGVYSFWSYTSGLTLIYNHIYNSIYNPMYNPIYNLIYNPMYNPKYECRNTNFWYCRAPCMWVPASTYNTQNYILVILIHKH